LLAVREWPQGPITVSPELLLLPSRLTRLVYHVISPRQLASVVRALPSCRVPVRLLATISLLLLERVVVLRLRLRGSSAKYKTSWYRLTQLLLLSMRAFPERQLSRLLVSTDSPVLSLWPLPSRRLPV